MVMGKFNICVVSGCYDILHNGHVRFFREVKSLCNKLIVITASDNAIMQHKNRIPVLSESDRIELLKSIKYVDDVVISTGDVHGLDFLPELLIIKPDALVVTDDDKYTEIKTKLCKDLNIQYIKLNKTETGKSTTSIRQASKLPQNVPSRVDFAGGWLDVPKYSIDGGYIVNCSVTPFVTLSSNPYETGCGMATSAIYSILHGKDVFAKESEIGVGWQDPAVILETGMCCWRSGKSPTLEAKVNPDFLKGKMAIYRTPLGNRKSGLITDIKRNYELIKIAGDVAYDAMIECDYDGLCDAVKISYTCQLLEGMTPLHVSGNGIRAYKYLGAGWGGYALILFDSIKNRDDFVGKHGMSIEPYLAETTQR